MGYSFDMRGRLACDICGQCGDSRKIKCPSGWCQAVAQCKACRDSGALLTKHPDYHANCARSSAESKARREREVAILEAGGALRCSAFRMADDRTRVIFRSKTGEFGFDMASATYNAIPLLVPATPDDYRKHGELFSAPANFNQQEAA